MTTTLQQLADLYAEHPDAVPDGWFTDRFNGHMSVSMESQHWGCVLGGDEAVAPPWFLDLALAAIRRKLWEEHCATVSWLPCGRCRLHQTMHDEWTGPLYDDDVTCHVHAYRTMKGAD